MRLFFLVLLGLSSAFAASTQTPLPEKLDFACRQCTPNQALFELSKTLKTNIAYSDDWFKSCPVQDFFFEKKRPQFIINSIIDCAPVRVSIDEGNITLLYKNRQYTCSGFVVDSLTGERLPGATLVFSGPTKVGITANEFGFFSATLPEGTYNLAISYISFAPAHQLIELNSHQKNSFTLAPNAALPEILISATAAQRKGYSQVPKVLPVSGLMPGYQIAPGGEPDILRWAARSSGVTSGTDGLGGMYVRGGNADQNHFLLDDVPVYNPGHALGLFSIFPANAIQSAKLWKGDFPASYGGRAASVLDIRTKDGNYKTWRGDASAGLFLASASTEGPIIRDKSSLWLGARWSYFGPWISALRKRENILLDSGETPDFNFYDINVKWNAELTSKDKVYLSWYAGADGYHNGFSRTFAGTQSSIVEQGRSGNNWGNNIFSARWNRVVRSNLFANTTLVFSHFKFAGTNTFLTEQQFQSGKKEILWQQAQAFQSDIRDLGLKSDLILYQNPTAIWKFGFSYTHHRFRPGTASTHSLTNVDSLLQVLSHQNANGAGELSGYVEVEKQLKKGWDLHIGTFASIFWTLNANYNSLQPRLTVTKSLPKDWSLRLSANTLTQYLHQVNSFSITLPFELWLPSNATVKPEKTRQISLGAQKNMAWGKISMEGYFKNFKSVLAAKDFEDPLNATSATSAQNWEYKIEQGIGKAYGLEWNIALDVHRNHLEFAYTWSRSERKFDDINLEKTFPFRFDRPHDLKIDWYLKLKKGFLITANWTFQSGNPITLSGVKYTNVWPGNDLVREVFAYSAVNGYRLPDYHRLDCTLTKVYQYKQWEHSWQVGVCNAYNRKNPFYLSISPNSGKAYQYTLLPAMPIFRYAIRFN